MMRTLRCCCSLVLIALIAVSAGAATKPNVVLVTLGSTRADRMGFLGAKGGITPNLDRLAAESFVFEHAYAQAPGIGVSSATILSGTYPQTAGMSEIGGTLGAALPYLPDLLKAQGYRTAAFVGASQLDAKNGLAQGFGRGFQTSDAGTASGAPRRPDQVVAWAVAWIARGGQGPFFVWIHLDAVYTTAASYNAAVTAEDTAVGKVLAALHQQKFDANTAVVVAASHGESLGAHGEDGHGIFLYDETTHVPLLVKLPEAQPTGKRVGAKVRLVDVAPTVLEVAGVSVPSQMQGQSLLRIARAANAPDQAVYARGELSQRGFGWSPMESWRAGKYLYIRAPKPELYDLTADPWATRNLAQSSKATADTMAAQLESFDRRFSGEGGKAGGELSSSEMQKLASLGYVGLQKSASASSAATGVDPKDRIAIANTVMAATDGGGWAAPDLVTQGKPDLAQEKAARQKLDAAGQARLDRAIAALTPIAAADPSIYLAQFGLGVALARMGKYDEAAKHLHRAVELQPDSPWAHYAIGATLLKTGDYKTAAVHLEIAMGRLPGFAQAHWGLAEAYEHLGRVEEAKKERIAAGRK